MTETVGKALGVLGLLWLVSIACSGVAWAGDRSAPPAKPRITESDVTPQSRPMTFSQLLDEYLVMVQETLKHETAFIQESGLAEVKLTIRKDGSVTHTEILLLDGPATLRDQLLPIVDRVGPLPPPPVDADVLVATVLLPLQYPSPDLLDSIDQER